jgi:hypothetical protein
MVKFKFLHLSAVAYCRSENGAIFFNEYDIMKDVKRMILTRLVCESTELGVCGAGLVGSDPPKGRR